MSLSPPSPPAQPPQSATYTHPSNPTTVNSSEAFSRLEQYNKSTSSSEGFITTSRTAGDIRDEGAGKGEEATPTALAYGVRDANADRELGDGGKEIEEEGTNPPKPNHDPNSDPDNQKMRVLAEGDVYAAQTRKHGFGEEIDLAAGLERKKKEQEDLKRGTEEGEESRRGDVDVKDAVGGKGKGIVVV